MITVLRRNCIGIVGLVLGAGAILRAEERPDGLFTGLTDYVAFGWANNAGLRADYAEYVAALQKVPQARSLPDPKVTATHLVEEIQTRTGPQINQLFLTQTIPWFGKLRLRGEVASKEAEALHHRYGVALLALSRDIALAFYDYAYLGRETEIAEGIVDLLSRLEEAAEEKVRAGAEQAPLLRLQVEIGMVHDMLQSLRKRRQAQNAHLNALLGRRSYELLPFPALVRPVVERPDRGLLGEALLAGNPELKALHSRIEKSARAVTLSKLSPIPDPTVGVGVFDTGPALNPSTPGSGRDPWGIQISFTIPLWFGKYRAERREAEERLRGALAVLSDRETMLLAELEGVLQLLAEVEERLQLYSETLLPTARQALEVTEQSYQAGRATTLEWIDSERSLLEIERGFWRAVADHHKAIVRLQTLTGISTR